MGNGGYFSWRQRVHDVKLTTSPPPSTEVKNEWTYTSTSPHIFKVSRGKVFTLQALLNTWNLFLIYPSKSYCNKALHQNNSPDDLSQQPKRKPEFTLFLCLRMFRTNAELFCVCIISLFSVSKTVKLREKGNSYKLFQSCVQILFEAFFYPTNIPLREKWVCLNISDSLLLPIWLKMNWFNLSLSTVLVLHFGTMRPVIPELLHA
jgi:hypothetical protein